MIGVPGKPAFGFQGWDDARCRRLTAMAPSPLPYPSQIGVHLKGYHPRSSQIGVEFSNPAAIGVGLAEFFHSDQRNQRYGFAFG